MLIKQQYTLWGWLSSKISLPPKIVSSVSVFEKDSQNKIQLPDIAWQYSFDNGQLDLSNYQWRTSEVPKDILDDGF